MQHVIELFVANHCPSCPDARARVREFGGRHPTVTVVERNVEEGWGTAARYGLFATFATPAIVIDGRTVLYGVPTVTQLATRCGLAESGISDTARQAEATSARPIDPATAAS